MADCDGQSVRGVLLRDFRKIQKDFEHFLHLVLGCPTMADHRLLDLKGCVFEYRQTGVGTRHDGRTPGLSKLQSALDIGREEDVFHGHGIGPVLLDDLGQGPVDFLQPQGEVFVAVSMDGTVIDMEQAVAALIDDAVACDA